MKRLLFGLLGILPGLAAGAEAERAATESYEGQVVRLEVGGRALADLRKFKEWRGALERAEKEKAQAVVLEIDASEGYIDETMELMGQVAGMTTPVYAFINGQALGAGALLAVSADAIYMTSDAVISGAGALDANGEARGNDRTRSLLLAKLRTVVAKRGHDVNMVRAMVVPAESELRFGEVIVPKGTILTLTSAEATASVDGRPLLARGVVENVDGLLAAEGLSGAVVLAGKEPAPKTEGAAKPPAERQGVKREEEGEENLIRAREESFEGKVVVLKVGETDLINDQSFRFWRRMLRRAEDEGARAVIFDLDTPGGLAFKTKEIMTEITRLKVPSFAFVNEDALSAGALVSVATDGIYMNPDGVIGAAGLVSSTGEIGDMMRKKLHSVFEAHVRGVAEKKGYDPELIRAMMIPDETKDRVFGDVVVKKGELLTLTASEATSLRDGQPLLAKGMVTSVEELAEAEGMVGAPIVRAEPTPFENFAWWVARFSPLLILVGIGAAYAEMKAPGFGVAGAISLTAFGVFFFGNYVAGNLAGYEMFALFLLGVVLLAVEIFLIPGTGVTGIAGALCIVASLLFGMVDKIDFGDWKVGEFDGSIIGLLSGPALNLGLALIGAVLLIVVFMRYLPTIPILRGLTLQKELAGGASIEDEDHAAPERIGWTGECLTDLRPAGKVQFRDEVLDVMADGDFVPKGTSVRIIEEDGMKIVVRES